MIREIPIFFSTDDNYIPYLDVAISSLIANASGDYTYRILVLNTGLDPENIRKVRQNERPGVRIDFVDISQEVEAIKTRLKNVYHFSVVTYYRLFIASLFPQYEKVIYLDCDLVVLGDVSQLYNIVMYYTDRFEIQLGSTEELDYKIKYLAYALESLTDKSGLIDLTFDQERIARFLPWAE